MELFVADQRQNFADQHPALKPGQITRALHSQFKKCAQTRKAYRHLRKQILLATAASGQLLPLLSDRTKLELIKQQAWQAKPFAQALTKYSYASLCATVDKQQQLSEETLQGVKHPKLPTPPDVELDNNLGSPLISYLRAEINVNSSQDSDSDESQQEEEAEAEADSDVELEERSSSSSD